MIPFASPVHEPCTQSPQAHNPIQREQRIRKSERRPFARTGREHETTEKSHAVSPVFPQPQHQPEVGD